MKNDNLEPSQLTAVIADMRQLGLLMILAGLVAAVIEYRFAGLLCAGIGYIIWSQAITELRGKK